MGGPRQPSYQVSVHDVMPETRPRVDAILGELEGVPARKVTLLVVPGRDWQGSDLNWLYALQARGYPLAGHGWRHRCPPPRGLYHRLHSSLLSRDVAEHLALEGEDVEHLIRDCHHWFVDHGLRHCGLYVPPAWALGSIPRDRLAELPFRWFETLGGVHDTRENRFHLLPLAGFEADTRWRAFFLRAFNGLNRRLALRYRRPLRVAIHPADLEGYLGGDLRELLRTLAGNAESIRGWGRRVVE